MLLSPFTTTIHGVAPGPYLPAMNDQETELQKSGCPWWLSGCSQLRLLLHKKLGTPQKLIQVTMHLLLTDTQKSSR